MPGNPSHKELLVRYSRIMQ